MTHTSLLASIQRMPASSVRAASSTIDLERADRAIVMKSALPVRKRSRAGIKSARGVHSTGPGKAVCEAARLAVLDERRSQAQRT